MVKSFYKLTMLALLIPMAAPGLRAQSLTVSAYMDIYRAGGYDDGSNGEAPAVFTFSSGSGHILMFSSVTGSWTCNGGVPDYNLCRPRRRLPCGSTLATTRWADTRRPRAFSDRASERYSSSATG